MTTAEGSFSCKSLAMNGGDGAYSYSRNSRLQKEGIDIAKEMITDAILETLDVESLLGMPSTFTIADLGCSVGPNTFFVVQNIVEAVIQKSRSCWIDTRNLEFQVFFNDRASNDFNMLFRNLPSERSYHVAAVPSSFHGQLFPKGSIHLVHSSYSLQWLSRVPEEVMDENSPAWNKGRIYIVDAQEDVTEAYQKQYAKDMMAFLDARAVELASGGLMALLLPMAPAHSKSIFCGLVQLLESAFTELVNMGLVDEKAADSFNVPIYNASPAELEALIRRNGEFTIEKADRVIRQSPVRSQKVNDVVVMHLRAAWEEIIKAHFGNEIVDALFEQFKKRVEESSILFDLEFEPVNEMFFLLKRL